MLSPGGAQAYGRSCSRSGKLNHCWVCGCQKPRSGRCQRMTEDTEQFTTHTRTDQDNTGCQHMLFSTEMSKFFQFP